MFMYDYLKAVCATAAVLVLFTPVRAAAQQEPPPKILLDSAPRAVEYQLGRLSNAELVRVERKDTDPRYRLIYYAFLTRKGLGREFFDEALTALTKLDKASRTRVLLEALPKVAADDNETADKLVRVLLAQPADALKKERDAFASAIESSSSPFVWRAAYGGLMTADGGFKPAWEIAAKHDGHLVELLRSVPDIATPELRAQLFDPIAALLKETPESAVRAPAFSALGWTRPDAATFAILAGEVVKGTDALSKTAAIESLQRLPKASWPAAGIEPLARALVALVKDASPDARTEPALLEAAQLADKLAAGLDNESGRAIRRELRDLGVQSVRIGTLFEQMSFDLRWFAVEAGKPVQIVFTNPDAMSHNLVVGKPGSLKEIGTAAASMTPSPDPKVKPYVPESPLVIQATGMLNWGETERLSFVAPQEPGEYVFVCTFPGHFVRMYGVMLVVPNLEAWEAKPTVPTDPMTNQPFASQVNR
jgi:azurin/DNA-binding transcriptional ArsR family regulator